MSEAGYVKDKHYQFLLEYFSGPVIRLRLEALWRDTVKVLESIGFEDKVRFMVHKVTPFFLRYSIR